MQRLQDSLKHKTAEVRQDALNDESNLQKKLRQRLCNTEDAKINTGLQNNL